MAKVNKEGAFANPSRSLDCRPTSQSVLFDSVFINLSTIALRTHLSVPHVSMIFSGKRQPSLASARKIAIALNMDLSLFVTKLDTHVHQVKPSINKSKKIA
jgi:transcriptional regulator with XRE-family HTH domain